MALWRVVLWGITAIDPFKRRDWLLENLLVFYYCGLLLVTSRRFRFSTLSCLLFTLFMSLHLVGAHDTYAEVPFGYWLQQTFHLARNHLRPHRVFFLRPADRLPDPRVAAARDRGPARLVVTPDGGDGAGVQRRL